MKATELRIGNYLYSNLTKNVFQVTAEDIVNIDKDPAIASPIELTERWLKDFGFTATLEYGGNGYILGNMIIFKVRSHGRSEDWFYEIEYCSGDEIEDRTNIIQRYDYVHQLQNLYFALTGKELTK